MVTRSHYNSNVRVPVDVAVTVASADVPPPSSPAPSSPSIAPAAPASPDDAIMRAIKATQRAEELRRQAQAHQPTIEQVIDGIRGLTRVR